MSEDVVEDIRVLAVDDNADLVDVVSEFLEREHDAISVTTATSVETALDRLAETAVDCIVSDYDMPERNGLDLLREVRGTRPDLPFILFTGKGHEEIASEAVFDHGYTTSDGGTGFGLSIVERIAEAHDWTVDVPKGRRAAPGSSSEQSDYSGRGSSRK